MSVSDLVLVAIYVLIGYICGMLFSIHFDSDLALTHWHNIWTYVWLFLWPLCLFWNFMVILFPIALLIISILILLLLAR